MARAVCLPSPSHPHQTTHPLPPTTHSTEGVGVGVRVGARWQAHVTDLRIYFSCDDKESPRKNQQKNQATW